VAVIFTFIYITIPTAISGSVFDVITCQFGFQYDIQPSTQSTTTITNHHVDVSRNYFRQ